MKPQTKLQHEVLHLHKTCLFDVKEHEPFMISKHQFYYTTHYKNLICLECNNVWKPKMEFWKEEVIGVECPCCKKKLKKIEMYNGLIERFITFSVVQVVGRFQVVRFFSCWKYMYKKSKPEYVFKSLFEEWKEYEKNKVVVIGRNRSWSGDSFNWQDYELRANRSSYGGMTDYDLYCADYNCPGAKFLPRFEKYGLGEDFHNCDWRTLIRKLENNSEIETLLKAKSTNFLFHAVHKDESYKRYWRQIKIALRHKYNVDDVVMWYDYLQMLQSFKKDINNPTIILPENLHKAHDEYMILKKKRQEIINKRQEEERRINTLKFEEEQRKRAQAEKALRGIKNKYFKDFKFKSGKIEVVTLIKEKDVKLEGDTLGHCVHTNNYHKKNGILLMSARIKEQPIETIEISLANFSIIQSRGFGNKATPHHDQIIEIVKRNMSKISRIVDKFKKEKNLQSA